MFICRDVPVSNENYPYETVRIPFFHPTIGITGMIRIAGLVPCGFFMSIYEQVPLEILSESVKISARPFALGKILPLYSTITSS